MGPRNQFIQLTVPETGTLLKQKKKTPPPNPTPNKNEIKQTHLITKWIKSLTNSRHENKPHDFRHWDRASFEDGTARHESLWRGQFLKGLPTISKSCSSFTKRCPGFLKVPFLLSPQIESTQGLWDSIVCKCSDLLHELLCCPESLHRPCSVPYCCHLRPFRCYQVRVYSCQDPQKPFCRECTFWMIK